MQIIMQSEANNETPQCYQLYIFSVANISDEQDKKKTRENMYTSDRSYHYSYIYYIYECRWGYCHFLKIKLFRGGILLLFYSWILRICSDLRFEFARHNIGISTWIKCKWRKEQYWEELTPNNFWFWTFSSQKCLLTQILPFKNIIRKDCHSFALCPFI